MAKTLLSNQMVIVSHDDTQGKRDKYGRLLAYITLPNGEDFGEVMIKGGYAYEYTYNLPYQKQSQYKSAEKSARINKVGLWADGACEDFLPETTQKNNPTQESIMPLDSNCTIKGNISRDGEKVYHVVGQQYYNQTDISLERGERWFCTEREAIEAGWRRALR
jgi:micrococcal nuclease